MNELNLVSWLEPVERQLVKVAVQDATAMHDLVATELGDDAGDVTAGASFVDAFDAQEDGNTRPGGQAGSLALRIGREELQEETEILSATLVGSAAKFGDGHAAIHNTADTI